MSAKNNKKLRQVIRKGMPTTAKMAINTMQEKLNLHRRNTIICTVLACLFGLLIGYVLK